MLTYTTLNILVYVETFNTCGNYGTYQQLHHKNNPSNPIDKYKYIKTQIKHREVKQTAQSYSTTSKSAVKF